jgi:hypothetical protein
VTTILKAVRELERRAASGQQPATSWQEAASGKEERRGLRSPWIRLLLVAMAGGVLAVGLRLPAPYAPSVISTPPAARERQVAPQLAADVPQVPSGAPQVPLGVAELPAGVAELPDSAPKQRSGTLEIPASPAEEAPWGRVETRAAAEPARPRPAPPVAAPKIARPRPPATQPAVVRRVEPPSSPKVERAKSLHDKPARTARQAPAGADSAGPDSSEKAPGWAPRASRVQVMSIAHSPDLADQTVTLRIGSAPPVTLHPGESASGFEVQLILPNAVYLRRGGEVFVVDATP